MPTADGRETIGEQLRRKRTDLVSTRAAIARAENLGQEFTVPGSGVTQVAYEAAQLREKRLEAEIRALESRAAGGRSRRGFAHTVTRTA